MADARDIENDVRLNGAEGRGSGTLSSTCPTGAAQRRRRRMERDEGTGTVERGLGISFKVQTNDGDRGIDAFEASLARLLDAGTIQDAIMEDLALHEDVDARIVSARVSWEVTPVDLEDEDEG